MSIKFIELGAGPSDARPTCELFKSRPAVRILIIKLHRPDVPCLRINTIDRGQDAESHAVRSIGSGKGRKIPAENRYDGWNLSKDQVRFKKLSKVEEEPTDSL